MVSRRQGNTNLQVSRDEKFFFSSFNVGLKTSFMKVGEKFSEGLRRKSFSIVARDFFLQYEFLMGKSKFC